MINFPRLTMRNINRIVLLLALGAPIVYLFGTQFTALAGAHGEEILADDVNRDTISVALDAELSINNSTGQASYDVRFKTSDYIPVVDTGSYGLSSTGSVNGYSGAYRTIYFYKNDYSYISYVLQTNSNLTSFNNVYSFSVPVDTSYLRIAYYVTASYSVSNCTLKGAFPSSALDYGNTLFGSMFPRDNFLVEWGNNSISNEPYGFAPIGTFFKYVDDNLLHFSANGAQFGLMSYGYMYYAAHVLLFDLVFYCGTFFISLIKGIVDKFTGGFEK